MDAHLPTLPREEPTSTKRLRLLAPGIWATRDEPLGGPANTCGFLIEREAGNAFIYSCSAIEDYYEHLDELGGVSLILLNHRDEATRHVTTLADHYNAPVHTHKAEVEASKLRGVRNIVPHGPDTDLGGDIQAQHTPGHTPGATSYIYNNPNDGLRYIFPGDTFSNFTIDHFDRVIGFHPYEENVDDMRQTLERLKDIDTDVIVPGLANGTINAYRWTTEQRVQLLDHALKQLPK